MKIEILHRTMGTVAQIGLAPEESIVVEPSAMLGMSGNVDVQTGMRGGFLNAMGRAFLGGENFFQNTYTARGGAGEMLIAHGLPGDMAVIEVPQAGLYIQSGSYIACDPQIHVETAFGGITSFFSGEGLFRLLAKANGPGQQIVVGAYGGMEEVFVDGEMMVDAGYLVAWDTSLNTQMVKASENGWIMSALSGEGLALQVTGRGRIWLQSRTPVGVGKMLGPLLPPKQL